MADIELIVKIPEEKIVIEYGEVISIGRNNDKELADYIFAGTPLTKSDDCVSREEAIKAIDNVLSEYSIYFLFRDRCTEALMLLPSVQPKPKTNVLDEIRTEIEKECEPCIYEIDFAYKHGLLRTLEIIGKYSKGQTDADSD